MVFDMNSWLLAKDHTRKEMDLSFVGCHRLIAIKANKIWQQKL